VKAANYISYIQGQLTATGEALYGPGNGFAYVPNFGPLNTGWADIDFSASKGLFAEGFALAGDQITDGDWNLSMDRALRITSTSNPANADRMFIMQPFTGDEAPDSPLGVQHRSWALGSYLLLRGDHTYINLYGQATSWHLEWYPEYQVNLGAPQDPGGMPTSVAGYYDPGSGLYVRYFENGIVLLNNSNASLGYDPGQVMQQVMVNGWAGGVRPGDIDPATNRYVGGWLSAQLVSTVTVAPYSSVILINQGTPIDISGGGPPRPGGHGLFGMNFLPPPLAPGGAVGTTPGQRALTGWTALSPPGGSQRWEVTPSPVSASAADPARSGGDAAPTAGASNDLTQFPTDGRSLLPPFFQPDHINVFGGKRP
jgi:hypothetical protein